MRFQRLHAAGAAVLLLATSVLVPRAGGAAAPGAAFDPMSQGRLLTRQFFAGHLDSLAGQLSPKMASAMSPAQLARYLEQVQAQFGAPQELVDESVSRRDSVFVYTRTGTYEKEKRDVQVVWSFDPQGLAVGFKVQPVPDPAPTRFMEYETKTRLRLPCDGEWFVAGGGRAARDNRHASEFDRRFALDLVVRKDGVAHAGDGRTNAQHYAWGQPVLAPGAGTVVATTDGIDDNAPGEIRDDKPLGNHIVIDHGEFEYSFLCHLQRGSIVVEPGQTVAAGDVVGKCGNSGQSLEPHLHFHLQNKPEPLRAEALPAQFTGYRADGQAVQRGEPKRGQTVVAGAAKPSPVRTDKKKPARRPASETSRTGDSE